MAPTAPCPHCLFPKQALSKCLFPHVLIFSVCQTVMFPCMTGVELSPVSYLPWCPTRATSRQTGWRTRRPPASVIWGEASGWNPNQPSQAVRGIFLFLLILCALQRKFLLRASSLCKLAPDNGGCKNPFKLSKFLCSSEPSN